MWIISTYNEETYRWDEVARKETFEEAQAWALENMEGKSVSLRVDHG